MKTSCQGWGLCRRETVLLVPSLEGRATRPQFRIFSDPDFVGPAAFIPSGGLLVAWAGC